MRQFLLRLPCARRPLLAGALLFLAACTRTGELIVIVDSTLAGTELEVMAMPSDPSSLLPAPQRAADNAQADSLRLMRALIDSSGTLDSSFTRLRNALNAEALSLQSIDRRSDEYAARYDEFRPRSEEAERLRSQRDALAARAESLRANLAHLLPDSARLLAASATARERIEAMRDGGRRTRLFSIDGTVARVQLAEGEWWIGIARPGAAPGPPVQQSIRTGASDTVRFGARGSR